MKNECPIRQQIKARGYPIYVGYPLLILHDM